jgi:hypothetical protein
MPKESLYKSPVINISNNWIIENIDVCLEVVLKKRSEVTEVLVSSLLSAVLAGGVPRP